MTSSPRQSAEDFLREQNVEESLSKWDLVTTVVSFLVGGLVLSAIEMAFKGKKKFAMILLLIQAILLGRTIIF